MATVLDGAEFNAVVVLTKLLLVTINLAFGATPTIPASPTSPAIRPEIAAPWQVQCSI